jgi:NifU-like protein involved in Fe-S cluster formation
MSDDLQQKIESAISEPKNLGEMDNADAVGTAGSADCGDMLRMWIKFREEGGKKVIDKATFQTFGCETAIAVASLATQLIQGKTPEEAMAMDGQALSADLGPLPPMRIHCAQLVEGALRQALGAGAPVEGRGSKVEGRPAAAQPASAAAPTLMDSFSPGQSAEKKVKVILKPKTE